MKYLVILLLCTIAWGWDENCGDSQYEDAGAENPSNQVVNGRDARQHEYPYQVSLVREDGTHFCGGSIITSRHVVTAAHCVRPIPPDFYVDIAKHRRLNDTDNPYRRSINPAEIIVHPDYDSRTFQNDITILVLEEELDFSTSDMAFLPICKPDPTKDYTGEVATVSGWGATDNGGILLPNVLQSTNLDVMSNPECRSCMSDIYPVSLCAGVCGQNEDDSCQGDSGGPLAYKDPNTNKFELIGVVSWGFSCAGLRPGVYARVTEFIDWIDGIVATK